MTLKKTIDKIVGELDIHIRDTYGVSPKMSGRGQILTPYYMGLKNVAKAILERDKFLDKVLSAQNADKDTKP